MGLVKLLTVGRSLRRVRDETHRYKLMTGAMPTFGFESGAQVGLEEDPGSEGFETAEERETTSDAKAMKMETGESSAKERSNAFLLARLSYKKNPFRSSARPAPRVEQLQGELSLEKVKVVCNDLSDSDLELVEASRPTEPAPNKANVFAAPTPDAEVKRPSWLSRLVSKVARARIQ
jgi:hypothetical protein